MAGPKRIPPALSQQSRLVCREMGSLPMFRPLSCLSVTDSKPQIQWAALCSPAMSTYSPRRDRLVSSNPAAALNPKPNAKRSAAPNRPSTSAMARLVPTNSWRALPPAQNKIPPPAISTQDSPSTICLAIPFAKKFMATFARPKTTRSLDADAAIIRSFSKS
jgi:hypothetical protein